MTEFRGPAISIHPHADEPLVTFAAAGGQGHWVTIDGAHVFIGAGGTIEKGPKHLKGKAVADAPGAHHEHLVAKPVKVLFKDRYEAHDSADWADRRGDIKAAAAHRERAAAIERAIADPRKASAETVEFSPKVVNRSVLVDTRGLSPAESEHVRGLTAPLARVDVHVAPGVEVRALPKGVEPSHVTAFGPVEKSVVHLEGNVDELFHRLDSPTRIAPGDKPRLGHEPVQYKRLTDRYDVAYSPNSERYGLLDRTKSKKSGSEPTAKFAASSGGGQWVTIHGEHVFIGAGGTIEKGPSHLKGKTVDQATETRHPDWPSSADLPQSAFEGGKQAKVRITLTPKVEHVEASTVYGTDHHVYFVAGKRAVTVRYGEETPPRSEVGGPSDIGKEGWAELPNRVYAHGALSRTSDRLSGKGGMELFDAHSNQRDAELDAKMLVKEAKHDATSRIRLVVSSNVDISHAIADYSPKHYTVKVEHTGSIKPKKSGTEPTAKFGSSSSDDIPASPDESLATFAAAPLEGGQWVTIEGAHVYIKDGKVSAGPDRLKGKAVKDVGKPGGKIPEKAPRDRSALAKAAYSKANAHEQRYAEAQEAVTAKAIGGKQSDDNKPVDVTAPREGGGLNGIEHKVVVTSTDRNTQLSVKASQHASKVEWEKSGENVLHTVALDHRDRFVDENGKSPAKESYSGHDRYYKRGSAGYRLNSMEKVRDDAHLLELMNTPVDKLPPKARPGGKR